MLTSVGRAAARRVQTTRLPSSTPVSAQLLCRQSAVTSTLPIRSFTASPWAGLPTSGDKKPAKKTTTTTKKATATKPKPKPKPKPKAKADKAKPKPKPKKETDPEKLEKRAIKEKKLEIRENKKWALNEKMPQLPASRWTLFLFEQKGDFHGNGGITQRMTELAEEFRNKSDAELKNYDERAAANRAVNIENFKAWVESHEPARIYLANKARRRLEHLTGKPLKKIIDERLPKRPSGSYALFVVDNHSRIEKSDAREKFTELSQAWKDLSTNEKSRYEERHADYSAKYKAEMDKIKARADVIKQAENEIA
ncbi:hypothetical protein FSARC_10259 [Fusarium sarcochroum]|uniref:HMG box domain-containing protein n=1 Tax=Fusarium sarcochroum TaxID=1208366 RepID=A0A8H4TNQ2_9HYPO|nr:hypothetical protein FSARC_10259 [Fusarium sarcochroum]